MGLASAWVAKPVREAAVVQLAKPTEGKARPSTVAGQALAADIVVGGDAHGGVDVEAAELDGEAAWAPRLDGCCGAPWGESTLVVDGGEAARP